MAKEYQSEKSPIFDSQKSKKTRRKLLKMSHIKAYKVDQMICNTRYNQVVSSRDASTEELDRVSVVERSQLGTANRVNTIQVTTHILFINISLYPLRHIHCFSIII